MITTMPTSQRVLSAEGISAFYHDEFVDTQVRRFQALVDERPRRVVDMGGGCGFFARALMSVSEHRVKVVDMDPVSVAECRKAGVEAEEGDALKPNTEAVDLVTFNMVLHHLVAGSEGATRQLQREALAAWCGKAEVLINEYVYESWFGDFSGWLIFQVTSSKLLSAVAAVVARFAPTLKANTFGIGVRFRSDASWRRLFADAGFVVADYAPGRVERQNSARRILLIRETRQDSYLLRPV